MSKLDDFGEEIDNPFADPSVQNITRNSTNAQNAFEEYNPFGDQFVPEARQPNNITASPVAVVPTTTQNIPQNQFPKNNVPQISTEELQRRQEELNRKAEELDRRERELQGAVPHLNNWPPLPDRCCFQPCFYQDINVDIPSSFQRIVRNLYYAWMFYTLTMCGNVVGGILLLFLHGNFTTFGLSIFYCFIFTPASYLCWFRPAYKAFRNDSSFNFMVFFFVYFFQTIITIFQTIGVPDTGYCGFILAIKQFETSTLGGIFIGIILLMISLCFATSAAANIMLLTKVHSIYRSGDNSIAKAHAEFANEFIRNQDVQQVTTSALNSAINSQINNRF